MLEAIFSETIYTVTLTGLTQWDYGQKLYIKGLDLPEVVQVHFSNDKEKEAIVRVATKQGEYIVVDIPNELLEKYSDITAWVYVVGENSGETIRVIYLKVDSRIKPQDFISHNPSAEDLLQDLIGKVNNNIKDNEEFKKDFTEEKNNLININNIFKENVLEILKKYGDFFIMMDIGKYIEVKDRRAGSMYFNATERIDNSIEQVIVMKEDGYIPPSQRQEKQMYFNTTATTEGGSNGIKASPFVGVRIVKGV